jgi:hypothetical protein
MHLQLEDQWLRLYYDQATEGGQQLDSIPGAVCRAQHEHVTAVAHTQHIPCGTSWLTRTRVASL